MYSFISYLNQIVISFHVHRNGEIIFSKFVLCYKKFVGKNMGQVVQPIALERIKAFCSKKYI